MIGAVKTAVGLNQAYLQTGHRTPGLSLFSTDRALAAEFPSASPGRWEAPESDPVETR